jgi:hypothetical protein
MMGTSFFLLRAANPVNPANLICPSIRAVVWANLGNLANPANPANPICLLICVAILANLIYPSICTAVWANPVNPAWVMLLHLANPINPAVVTQIFSLVRDLCSNICHPQVAWPDHRATLG